MHLPLNNLFTHTPLHMSGGNNGQWGVLVCKLIYLFFIKKKLIFKRFKTTKF